MVSFVIRRILGSLVVLLFLSVITFIIIYAIPADPARMIVGPKAPMSVVLGVRHQLGLDQPIPLQYWHYLLRLLRGNLGVSYQYDQSVTSLIFSRLGTTSWLALSCWVTELAIGIPLGIYTARRARKISDYIVSSVALVGLSLLIPFLGIELLYVFAFKLSWFPLGGSGGIYHLILPALTYAITGGAYYIRLLKASMLEVLNQDYVRTARAKGAKESRVIWRHVIRNAIIPAVTFAGIDVGYLFGGIVLMEVTFNINGIGTLAFNSIGQSDIPVIMGTVLFAAVLVVVFNLIVDMLYAVIDPRIRYS